MQMQIDIELIKSRLFHLSDRKKILDDFGLGVAQGSPENFASAILEVIGQTPQAVHCEQSLENRHIFRAAVRALGSNARSWSAFLKREPHLKGLLHDYDPKCTHEDVIKGKLNSSKLAEDLPGQTSTRDAKAILDWSESLAGGEKYYPSLIRLRAAFQSHAEQRGWQLECDELFLCVAAYLGDPPRNWHEPTSEYPSKAPGMRYILASEFLRNIHWNGFKPDRHVKRLLRRWVPEILERVRRGDEWQNASGAIINRNRVSDLVELVVGTRTGPRDLRDYLEFSLVGINISPPQMHLSHVDNLVWLLGRYVEKKGLETSTRYVLP